MTRVPDRLSIFAVENFGVSAITFWWGGRGVRTNVEMIDFGPRHETATLRLVPAVSPASDEHFFDVPACSGRFGVSVLVDAEGAGEVVRTEIGIEFTCDDNVLLSVLADPFPLKLAVDAPFLPAELRTSHPRRSNLLREPLRR